MGAGDVAGDAGGSGRVDRATTTVAGLEVHASPAGTDELAESFEILFGEEKAFGEAAQAQRADGRLRSRHGPPIWSDVYRWRSEARIRLSFRGRSGSLGPSTGRGRR